MANPFHHAFFVVSKISDIDQKIEVKNAWGFYPVGISNPGSYWSKFKKSLGFNFDLQGNYGILKVEEMRYLDLGYALHGISFEIDDDQYRNLKKLCREIIDNQEIAVNEAKQNLQYLGREPGLHEIFEEEKRHAQASGGKSRLRPFEMRVSMCSSGWSLAESYNCKTMAIELMIAIGVPRECLASLTPDHALSVMPRYSGELEDIYFHSTGSLNTFQSERTGAITLFKKWGESKLYWSLPPQCITRVGKNDAVEYDDHEYALPSDWAKAIKQSLSRLQQIENVVIHADIDYSFESCRNTLQKKIFQLYEKFATMNAELDYMEYQEYISKADNFLTRMYHAIHDDYFEKEYIESITSLLDRQSQEKICDILELPFNKPAYIDDDNGVDVSNPVVSLTRF